MQTDTWYTGMVLHGDRYGRTLGFPTANLDPALLVGIDRDGVYRARVTYDNQNFIGALYFGPRITLGESVKVLEIHIIDFSDDIYGKTISFTLEQYIRPPMDFASTEELIRQLQNDISAVKNRYRS